MSSPNVALPQLELDEYGSVSVSAMDSKGNLLGDEHVICRHGTNLERAFQLARRATKRMLKEYPTAREIGITMQKYRDV